MKTCWYDADDNENENAQEHFNEDYGNEGEEHVEQEEYAEKAVPLSKMGLKLQFEVSEKLDYEDFFGDMPESFKQRTAPKTTMAPLEMEEEMKGEMKMAGIAAAKIGAGVGENVEGMIRRRRIVFYVGEGQQEQPEPMKKLMMRSLPSKRTPKNALQMMRLMTNKSLMRRWNRELGLLRVAFRYYCLEPAQWRNQRIPSYYALIFISRKQTSSETY